MKWLEKAQSRDFSLRKKPILVLLAIVIAFQVILAGAWLSVDRTPPYWDEAWYLLQGAMQLEHLQEGDVRAWFSAWSTLDRTRPSLVPTLVVPFFATLGISATSGLVLNLVALVVLLLVAFLLGRSIHGPPAGLLSALVVGSFPVLIGLAHILLVEMVMVTLVAATLLALWLSDGFRRGGWTCAAGLLTGLGFLTKVFFGVFVVGPWLVTMWQAWRSRPDSVSFRRWPGVRHFLIGLSILVITAGAWYAQNLPTLLRRSSDAAIGAEAAAYGPAHPWYWRDLLAYFFSFVGTVISPAGFLLLLLALAGLLLASRRRWGQAIKLSAVRAPLLFLMSSIIPTYIVFTSIRNQDMKHVTGILPALAVLMGWGLVELFRHRWAVGAGLAGAVMISQAVMGTFPGPLKDQRFAVTVLGEQLLLFYPAQTWSTDTRYAAPDPRPWPLEEVLNYAVSVGHIVPRAANPVRIGVIPDAPGLEEHALRFEAYRHKIPVEITTAQHLNLQGVDVLIHKTGDWGWSPRHSQIEMIMQELAGSESGFHQLPRNFSLPDGSEVVLYARVPPVLDSGPPVHEVSVEFPSVGRFRGYDCTVSGNILNLRYYWESFAPTSGDYSLFVHFIDLQTGQIVVQDDHLLLDRIYPTSTWQAGRLVAETRQISLPVDYTGASLIVRLGLYQGETRLPVASSSDVDAGFDYADVGRVDLSP